MKKAFRQRDSWPGLEVAHAHLQPIESFLDHIGSVIAQEYHSGPVLERHAVKPIARNTYDVEYIFRSSGDTMLELGFIVTGNNADVILLQTRKTSGDQSRNVDPGQVEQRVFHLDE